MFACDKRVFFSEKQVEKTKKRKAKEAEKKQM